MSVAATGVVIFFVERLAPAIRQDDSLQPRYGMLLHLPVSHCSISDSGRLSHDCYC